MTTPRNTDEIGNKGGITDPAAVKQELDGIKAKLDEAQAALANTPTKSEIDQINSSIEALKSTVENLPTADYSDVIKALTEQVETIQTTAALRGTKAADQPTGIKAITRALADADVYKQLQDAGRVQTPHALPDGSWSAKTVIPSLAAVGGLKAANPVVIADVSGQDLTAYRPGVFMDQYWAMNIASRIPSVAVGNATTYTIPKETEASRYGAFSTTLTTALDGDPTPKSSVDVQDSNGVMIGSTHRFYDSSDALLGSAVVVSFDAASSPNTITYTTSTLTWDAAIGSRVVSENYAATAEGTTKPSGAVGDKSVSFTLKTLASIIPTTVNALNTVPGLEALIERKLPERHMRNLSRHLIYGDGSADELQGLRPYTGAQTYSWSGGVVGDNRLDAVMKAANLIPWTSGIGVIMSQQDLPNLTLLKDSTGNYLRTGNFGMVPLVNTGMAWYLGAFELVFDYAVASTHFTVINWADASEMAEQANASLMWGYINDDFAKNIIRARYEATLAHAIKSTQAYVVGTWDSAPT